MNEHIEIISIMSLIVIVSYTLGFLLGIDVGKREAKEKKI